MIAPRQLALALIGPDGRLVGYVPPPAVLGRYAALAPEAAAKFATAGDLMCWLATRVPCVLGWLYGECRLEPVGLIGGGHAPL